MIAKTFKMPKGCDIDYITLRETTIEDELDAAEEAEAEGGVASSSRLLHRLVVSAIVAVDKKRVKQPFTPPTWSSRTWQAIRGYYTRLNGTDQKELQGNFEAAEDWPDDSAAAASSGASTSGDPG
jgi:hypothetical protein